VSVTETIDWENGLSDGTALTLGNYAGSGDGSLDLIENAFVSTRTGSFLGARSVRFTAPGTTGSTNQHSRLRRKLPTPSTDVYFRIYGFRDATTEGYRILRLRDYSMRDLASVILRSDGRFELRNVLNNVVGTGQAVTSTAGIPGAMFRIEGHVHIDSGAQTNNVFELKVWTTPIDSATPNETITFTNVNFGGQGGKIFYLEAGICSPTYRGDTLYLDGFGWSDTSYLGAGSPPTDSWSWRWGGPPGAGGRNHIVYDPNVAGRLISASDTGGSHESLDGGKTWHGNRKGLYAENCRKTASCAIFDDPGNPGSSVDVLLMNSGIAIRKATDSHWTVKTTSGSDAHWNSKAFETGNNEPRTNGELWLVDPSGGGSGHAYYLTYRDGLWRTNDYAATDRTRIAFHSPNNGTQQDYFGRCLAFDPSDTNIIYAGMNHYSTTDKGLFKVTATNLKTVGQDAATVTKVHDFYSVEDILFLGSTMYVAAATDGIFWADPPYTTWHNIEPTSSASTYWKSITGYVTGTGNHVLLCICWSPARVDANGNPSSSGIKYGNIFRTANAHVTSPTWAYVSDPGSTGFPSGGDQDVSVNDINTAVRFWVADYEQNNMPGRSGGQGQTIRFDPHDGTHSRILTDGWGGIYFRHDNGGQADPSHQWQSCQGGAVIVSNRAVKCDPLRAGYLLFGNQDHDGFWSPDSVATFPRHVTGLPQPGGFAGPGLTIGYSVYCSPIDGMWYLADGDDTTNSGVLNRAFTNIGGSYPSVTIDPAATPSWGVCPAYPYSPVANKGCRIVGICDGWANGSKTAKRLVVYTDSGGIRYSDNNGTSWTTPTTNVPGRTLGSNTRATPWSLIWPDPASQNLYVYDREGNRIYQSKDRGVTWASIRDTTIGGTVPVADIRQGWLCAKQGQSDVLYYTDGGGNLYRIRNATTTPAFDLIAGVSNAAACAFDINGNGNLYVHCTAGNSTTPAKMLRAKNAPTTGAITFDDLFDSASKAADTSGQEHGAIGGSELATDDSNVYLQVTADCVMVGSTS
jgi:hypothetical protein